MEEWHAIQVLKRQGHGKKAVARQLKISRNTVKRYWDSQTPPSYRRAATMNQLDPSAPQIREMMAKRFIGTRIFHELTSLGYTGSLTSVYRYLKQLHDDRSKRATIHFETPPGHQMQYDWKAWQVPVAGQPVKLYFHQAIPAFSRYKLVTFSLDLVTPTIIRVLIQALAAFQGCRQNLSSTTPSSWSGLTTAISRGSVFDAQRGQFWLTIFRHAADPHRPVYLLLACRMVKPMISSPSHRRMISSSVNSLSVAWLGFYVLVS